MTLKQSVIEQSEGSIRLNLVVYLLCSQNCCLIFILMIRQNCQNYYSSSSSSQVLCRKRQVLQGILSLCIHFYLAFSIYSSHTIILFNTVNELQSSFLFISTIPLSSSFIIQCPNQFLSIFFYCSQCCSPLAYSFQQFLVTHPLDPADFFRSSPSPHFESFQFAFEILSQIPKFRLHITQF